MIPSQRLSDKCFEALVVISQAFIAVVAGVAVAFALWSWLIGLGVAGSPHAEKRSCNRRIKALEDRRYSAILAGDMAVLDELCSDDLIYTHSKADYDDKRSYLHKVGSRYFIYLEITHPADRILVVDSAALVTERMTAKVGWLILTNRTFAWRNVCCGANIGDTAAPFNPP
jgi:hypothetical protein